MGCIPKATGIIVSQCRTRGLARDLCPWRLKVAQPQVPLSAFFNRLRALSMSASSMLCMEIDGSELVCLSIWPAIYSLSYLPFHLLDLSVVNYCRICPQPESRPLFLLHARKTAARLDDLSTCHCSSRSNQHSTLAFRC